MSTDELREVAEQSTKDLRERESAITIQLSHQRPSRSSMISSERGQP
jgi:hypothetical protein